ncbi:MAG: UPF0147 family protein [Candidatus Micrarchaeota archaeon]|nr:UPF0147 family protein [Candidatus Micrarchaeota archaeon]
MKDNIDQIAEMLSTLTEDTTIPKNIRKALSEARDRLKGSDDANIKVSAAVYLIESISEDINMPSHARTQVWAVMSMLESLKINPIQ